MPKSDAPIDAADSGITHTAAGVVGAVALAALVVQDAFLLQMPDTGGAVAATVRFFSDFTIISNVGVTAICLASDRALARLRC